MRNKILHITTVPETLFFFTDQVKYMKKKGFNVHAISSGGTLLEKFSKQEGIQVHAVNMARKITPIQDLLSILLLVFRIFKIKPDIVHAHTPKGGLLGVISSFLCCVPIRIYHIHGLAFMTKKGLKRLVMLWSEKISCLLANQVLCVSTSIREVAISERVCSPSKIKVICNGSINGIDSINKFNPYNHERNIRKSLNIPENAIVLGFVGRIVHDKGINELVEAWRILKREYHELHLLIVGTYESTDPISEDTKRKIETDPSVHLVGFVENTSPMYAAMDIFVFPTYREGFGMVAIEASSMELPVIATKIPGCLDSVVDGETGILVTPKNVDELSDAIRLYIDCTDVRKRHGKNGRRRVLKEFRQEAVWAALHKEYTDLLRRKFVEV